MDGFSEWGRGVTSNPGYLHEIPVGVPGTSFNRGKCSYRAAACWRKRLHRVTVSARKLGGGTIDNRH